MAPPTATSPPAPRARGIGCAGEPPAFGGVGGTCPAPACPRRGKRERGRTKFLAAAGDWPRSSPPPRHQPRPSILSLPPHSSPYLPPAPCFPALPRKSLPPLNS